MAKGFEEIDGWVNGLGTLARELESGADFFRVHEERYVAIAQRVGGQTLLALRPDDVDPQEWLERVSDFVDLIFSRMSSGGDALEIIYAGRTEEDAAGKVRVQVNYDDVLEWVKAGVAEGGKDVTAIETNRGRSSEQIAYDVHNAIEQYRLGLPTKKDYSGITERLERWVESRVLKGDFADMLVVVLSAWREAVGMAMEKDLADWVDDEVRRAF